VTKLLLIEDDHEVRTALRLALEDDGYRVATVSVSRPSLDDVYLRYAGRSYRTADAAPSPATPEGASR
jgi:ABC-2 type transport system ATP-binding protein